MPYSPKCLVIMRGVTGTYQEAAVVWRTPGTRAGLRHRHALHTALQPMGPTIVPDSERGPVQVHSIR